MSKFFAISVMWPYSILFTLIHLFALNIISNRMKLSAKLRNYEGKLDMLQAKYDKVLVITLFQSTYVRRFYSFGVTIGLCYMTFYLKLPLLKGSNNLL